MKPLPSAAAPESRRLSTDARRVILGSWLLQDRPHDQIVAKAQEMWNIRASRVRADLKAIEASWEAAAMNENELAFLWKATGQQEELRAMVMAEADRAHRPGERMKLLALAAKLLRERNQLMAKIVKVRPQETQPGPAAAPPGAQKLPRFTAAEVAESMAGADEDDDEADEDCGEEEKPIQKPTQASPTPTPTREPLSVSEAELAAQAQRKSAANAELDSQLSDFFRDQFLLAYKKTGVFPETATEALSITGVMNGSAPAALGCPAT